MAVFNSITIEERGQAGIMTPQHGAQGNVSVRPRASSSGDPVIDRGGTALTTFTMPIRCGAATLASLRSSAGVSDSLVYSGGTITAVLVELGDAQKVVDTQDVYFASLTFIACTSNTTVSTPAISVMVDGADVSSSVINAVVSHGIEQTSGQASIVFDARPNGVTEGGSVTVGMGGNVRFDGTVTGRSWEHFPVGVGLDCRDRMEYLSYPYGGTERTYVSTTGGSIQQNISEAMGIASANMSIEDDGATVGVVQTIVFRQGDRFLPWIRENDNLRGYVTFTKGVDSAIFRRPLQYGVTGAGTHTLTEGVNILSAKREITRDGIYNGVQVDGFTYEGASVSVFLATANADVRNPPGTISMYIQSNLIETPAMGTTVALEQLSQHNFKPERGQITLSGTAIDPMDVLIVTHADLEMSGATVIAAQVEDRYDSGGYITVVNYRRIR